MSKLVTRKRGKTWEWRFESAQIDGKRKQISKGGYRTKVEAVEAGTKAKAEYDNAGLHFNPSEISVSDYYDFWLSTYGKTNLKEVTLAVYQKRINSHIKPALGKYQLKSLTPAVIQQFITNKFNAGYSRNSLMNLKGLLTGPLDYAVEPLQYIKYNPAKSIRIPSPRAESEIPTRKKERQYVPEKQWNMIIARFPEGHPAHIPLQLAYRCGLRLGEAFALTWDDIDFVAGTININKQVQNINQHWQFKAPKYDSSRIITMDSKISDLLARTKAQQKKDAQFYGDLYTRYYSNSTRTINSDGDGYEIHLVNVRGNGSYIQPRIMQHCFRIVHYQLDLPKVDYHSLRHTHATILIENDAPIKSVQARLGHRTVKETLDIYTHATKKMDAKVLNILDSI